jgi:hypothetical protein
MINFSINLEPRLSERFYHGVISYYSDNPKILIFILYIFHKYPENISDIFFISRYSPDKIMENSPDMDILQSLVVRVYSQYFW